MPRSSRIDNPDPEKRRSSPPQVLVVEGVWGVGKTTYIKQRLQQLAMTSPVWLTEPDHRSALARSASPAEVWYWYFEAHSSNLALASALAQRGVDVLIERSPAASLAFGEVFLSMSTDSLAPHLSQARQLVRSIRYSVPLQVVYLPLSDVARTLTHMQASPPLRRLAYSHVVVSVDAALRVYLRALFGDLA